MEIFDIVIEWFVQAIYEPVKKRFGSVVAVLSVLFATALIISGLLALAFSFSD